MQDQNMSRSGNILVVLCLLLCFMGLIATLFVPVVSETIQVMLLGAGLLVAGIWGRRMLRQY
jgi:hypothetical protein